MASLKCIVKMAQLEPLSSSQGMLAGSCSMVAGGMGMVAVRADEETGVDEDRAADEVGWEGPIT